LVLGRRAQRDRLPEVRRPRRLRSGPLPRLPPGDVGRLLLQAALHLPDAAHLVPRHQKLVLLTAIHVAEVVEDMLS
jgi:hypothetical protein